MARNSKDDVVARAVDVLDRHGLADLTVRRLAEELGVRPSALYHHFSSKQELLAAVAEEVLDRGPRTPRSGGWQAELRTGCLDLHTALLAVRDGAEVVGLAHALGLGADRPRRAVQTRLQVAGASPELAETAALTLLHLVLGHATEAQTRHQAQAVGARTGPGHGADVALALDLVLAGVAARLETAGPQRQGEPGTTVGR